MFTNRYNMFARSRRRRRTVQILPEPFLLRRERVTCAYIRRSGRMCEDRCINDRWSGARTRLRLQNGRGLLWLRVLTRWWCRRRAGIETTTFWCVLIVVVDGVVVV